MRKEDMVSNLQWEWERYMLDMMCTSKKNIFAKAGEIVTKKFIYKTLVKNADKFSKEEQRMLCVHESIIDSLFLELDAEVLPVVQFDSEESENTVISAAYAMASIHTKL